MPDTADMILPMLREMRSQAEARDRRIEERIGQLERHMVERFEKLEKKIEDYRHALRGDTLMGRLVTGEFEERIEALGPRLRAFEGST